MKINKFYKIIILGFLSFNLSFNLSYAESVVRLSPELRVLDNNEQNQEQNKLTAWKKNFLNIQVLQSDQIENLPRVISNVSGTLLPHLREEIYISNLDRLNYKKPLAIYRLGRPILSPENKKKILGYPLVFIADVKLKQLNTEENLSNLSIVSITGSTGEVLVGDRVLEKKAMPDINLVKNKNNNLKGNIVYILETAELATSGQNVIINLGKKDGVQSGNKFSIVNQKPVNRTVQLYEKDMLAQNDKSNSKILYLPEEKIGDLIVYNTFENLSLALITSSKDIIYLNQKIKNKK